jgi:hypothetical protein
MRVRPGELGTNCAFTARVSSSAIRSNGRNVCSSTAAEAMIDGSWATVYETEHIRSV